MKKFNCLVFFVLLTLLPIVLSIPQGFTTYFAGSSCPTGWYEQQPAKGRLIVSVADAENIGITVNAPLKDREDRSHTHVISTSLNLIEKDIAADDCCNAQGACHANYPINLPANYSTSGLPFVQLLLCTINGTGTSEDLPFGTVAFFNPDSPSAGTCPDNWHPLAEYNGRILIPGYAETGPVISKDNPLQSGEDITHTHSYKTNILTNDVSYIGAEGCCNKNLAQNQNYIISGETGKASSGLPYIQLLTCVSKAKTFDAKLPPSTLLFNQVDCPNGWNSTYDIAGRFPIALPSKGLPGASFGGDSIAPDAKSNPMHTHEFRGTVTTQDCEVGLGAGCCGSGYAKNQVYPFSGTSEQSQTNIPYAMLPLCQQV